MTDHIIIKTGSEERALIPDKWVLGNGLTTDGIYVIHTDSPFMIVQFPPSVREDKASKINSTPCVVYLNGEINPMTLNRLFDEAWQLMEIYKSRTKTLPSIEGGERDG